MRPFILPVPLIGLLLRIEFVPVARRPANDVRFPPASTVIAASLRRELSPRVLQDIGLDQSRCD
jgi:hypothetical protein